MQQEHDLKAGDLSGRHVGSRVYIKRTDRGEVMSGQLAAVEHRLLAVPPPDQPASIATDVTIRWDPDVFFRLTLHPGELVAVIRIDR